MMEPQFRVTQKEIRHLEQSAFARGFRSGLVVSPRPLSESVVLGELKIAWQKDLDIADGK